MLNFQMTSNGAQRNRRVSLVSRGIQGQLRRKQWAKGFSRRSVTAIAAVLAFYAVLPGCSARHARAAKTIISGLCTSPNGQAVAFNVTPPSGFSRVEIVSTGKPRAAERVAHPRASVHAMGWSDDRHLYILDDGRVIRCEIGTLKQTVVPITLPARDGRKVRITMAVYAASPDLFVAMVGAHGSRQTIYVAPRSTGQAEPLVTGRLLVHALGPLTDRRTLLMIASEHSEDPEKEEPTVGGNLRLYYYPATHPRTAFSLGAGRGFTGLGAISADGKMGVLPYRDYTWKPTGGHLYIVDLPGGKVRRVISLKDGASVARIEGQDRFLVVGPDMLATLDLPSLQLKAIPGGPVGVPSSITTTKNMQAIIATYPDVKIHIVDIATGKRRVLWHLPQSQRH